MGAVAADLVSVLQLGVIAALVALAGLALVRAPRSGQAGWWAATAFGALAVALSLVWLPEPFGWAVPTWAERVTLVAMLAFPYLLLRFTATFNALPRPVEVAAAAGAVVSAGLLVLPGLGSWGGSLLVVVAYWAGVSLVTVVRLWRAGRGEPGVARRRMRLMAVGAAVLTAALLVAVQADDAPLAEIVTHVLVLVSVLGFGLGFSPPRALRLSWRRHEEARLRAATIALLRADSLGDVADSLLQPTMEIIGASGVALVGPDGLVVATHGHAPGAGETVEVIADGPAGNGRSREVTSLGEGHGALVVWTSPYMPFFGPEERGLVQSMAAVAGLALERSALLADERAHRDALDRARVQAEAAQREAEQARREADAANLAKSEFLSRMSHELRTPLNAVLGFGQLLEISELTEEDLDAVGHIMKAGRHLLALIDDVLDLSRIEAGTLTISLEPVHAGDLVQDSIALVQPLATPRSIRIVPDPHGCDAYVLTDRQRCRQILLNLLSNAVKYNHDRGSVSVTCTPVDDDTLRIAVRDTGPGIDPARRNRLFEPFDRLGAEASGVQGTGLGLALTRQLVERLGGSIDVETGPGQGTTFFVDLPITVAPTEPETLPLDSGRTAPDGEHQILLVEDNLANLRLVEAVLRRRPGLSVVPAMQGTLALELAYQHRPAIVVLDLHLPDMSGRDVLARLKADPRTRAIPVIVASADATPRRVRQLRDDGAFDYLTKPLDVQRFLDVVDAALAQSSTHR